MNYLSDLRTPQRFIESSVPIRTQNGDAEIIPDNSQRQKYTNSFALISQTGYSFVSNCAEVFFKNLGTANVVINNVLTLGPGDFIGLDGQWNELDITQYNINFEGAGTTKLFVIRKIYC